MGYSCKPFGKFESVMRKLDNKANEEDSLVKKTKGKSVVKKK